ncbi:MULTISPECIES: hypothetical protein [Salinimicrobium]|jgi:hypothetical protein|uniref:hypothetical protein n=1 Tax=Salinimicrobium TaxID=561367 RepID=UPI001E647899|nr:MULTISPECIES: hypothetical protein [Salinimicrobium]MCC8359091.1 hypothetical protein [Salinimicrobium sediminilitoris]MCY2688253.1 hypothetical protein [Salinimicrobium sp. TH3]
MKDRILKNWTWVRAAYVIIGLLVTFQAASAEQWWGLGLGVYVAAMGVFGFGCAGGNCAGGNCAVEPEKDQKISN